MGVTLLTRFIQRTLLASLSLFLAACVGVPFDQPKNDSYSKPAVRSTTLGRDVLDWQAEHPGKSGFIGLPSGTDALGARLRLIASAESTLDAQYFILKNDRAGALFTGKMLRAADRGVRVRLLIDDIFSPGIDRPLTLLDSHPNIEVRLFNPLSRESFKSWSFLWSFGRVNRRMHNKSFTADSVMSIVGGRNIGEEYFQLKESVIFEDYEVLAVGPVVSEINTGFDMFWNSELAVPIDAFGIKTDPAELDEWRKYIHEKADISANGIYAKAVNSRLLQDIREKKVEPIVADAEMITDSPDKLLADIGDPDHATLAVELGRRMRAADREILIITPYFIPQESGTRRMEELLARGVNIVIVTNSLASTNHVAVHSGYARYRKRLLKAGAEIYETRADFIGNDTDWGHKAEGVTLHSKASVIDRETIFVGSLNFDPRSILINSEMGIFIENSEVGAAFSERLLAAIPRVSYKVDLDENNKLRWTYEYDGRREVLHKEPQAGPGRRFMAGFYGLLPIENQL